MPRFYVVLILMAGLTACSENKDIAGDIDGDGISNELDAFPHNPLEFSDRDKDGVGDRSDAFPDDMFESQDTDGDGLGDNSDPDIDNDGLLNSDDDQPYEAIGQALNTSDESGSYISNGQICYVQMADAQQIDCADRIPLSEAINNIADEQFRLCLSETLSGIDYADEVTHIYCPKRGIKALDGIQKFARLRFLDAGNNAINHIDVSDNPGLQRLYLAANQLTSINVGQNTLLQSLNLNYNQIQSIDIAANKQLGELHLTGNRLTVINIDDNTELKHLSLASNQLQQIDILNNTQLTQLTLADNRLSNINLEKNTALTHLSLSVNSISEIDISNNTALRYLNINQNKIKNFDASAAEYLLGLSLVANELTSIKLDKNFSLSYLDISKNHLVDVDISKNTELTALYLNDNQLNFTSIASDIKNISHKNVKINLSGNQFDQATVDELVQLEQLLAPYTAVSYLPQQTPFSDFVSTVKLIYTKNISPGVYEFFRVTADDQLVKFADSTIDASSINYPTAYLEGNFLFITLNTSADKYHLYNIDETGTQSLLKTFDRPVSIGSNPYDYPEFIGSNNSGPQLFTAYTEAFGKELWKTDGTAAGTVMLKDICPGNCGVIGSFHYARGKWYFGADDSVTGYQLWSTDGSTDGTQRISSIVGLSGFAEPYAAGGYLYAKTGDSLLQIDVSDNIKEIFLSIGGNFYPPYTDLGNFICGRGLDANDGFMKMMCINHESRSLEILSAISVTDSDRLKPLGLLEGKLYYVHYEDDGDVAAYVTSGTDATTRLHSYIINDGSGPIELYQDMDAISVNGNLVFKMGAIAYQFDGLVFSRVAELIEGGVGPYEYQFGGALGWNTKAVYRDNSSMYMMIRDEGRNLFTVIKTDLTLEGTTTYLSIDETELAEENADFETQSLFYKYYYEAVHGNTYVPSLNMTHDDHYSYIINYAPPQPAE